MGRNAFFWSYPEEGVGRELERGSNYFDLLETSQAIKCMDMATKENIRMAKRLEALAQKEENLGHVETAFNYFHRAALFYASAAWPILDSDDPELLWLNERIRDCYDKVIKNSRHPMERVEIPFRGTSIPGILHLTPSKKKSPTVLLVPGMDDRKERAINPFDNAFVNRGLNCLVIDGPGQGECLIRKIWLEEDNYAIAGSAAIDYLKKRSEVDADKISVYGHSMGSYWAPTIAMRDPRVKALATAMSCYYDKHHIFNETSPNFRLRFMWMTNTYDDSHFDELVSRMTLEGKESMIKCPSIVFHAELDHLTNTQETYRYFDALGSQPKELRIYENQYHGLYRVTHELFMGAADWLRDRLMGVPPVAKRRVVMIDWQRNEIPVDEKALAAGFSLIRTERMSAAVGQVS